ncbi:hypothetical protein Tco_0893223 [Tanacetum coccineum]|uniref:Uncharacterized protein n=1 Tax=Tanacetum coccineum TaxID=301880 RepID=A0ABQ5C876_9ASTR
MVRLWWLWWPQPAWPPPQRWHQAAEHSEAPWRRPSRLSTAKHPRGVTPPQPDTTWCGCGGCTVVRPPPQWWFGGGQPLMDQKQGPKLTTKLNIVFTLDVTTMHKKYKQDPEVSRCFMGCSAVALVDPPPTARHDGGSGWKSRRSCGGRGSCVGGWRDEVEWLEAFDGSG